MALFKIYSFPTTVSGASTILAGSVVSDSTSLFISAQGGVDSNSATRALPISTIAKAVALGSASKYLVLSGQTTENVTTISYVQNAIVGDTPEAAILGNVSTGAYQGCALINLIITGGVTSTGGCNILKCVLKSGLSGSPSTSQPFEVSYNFMSSIALSRFGASGDYCKNNTIGTFAHYLSNTSSWVKNSIIISSVDLYNYSSRANLTYYPIFQYCLFRKLTAWKWNGTTITINWTTNPNTSVAYTTETLLERVYQSLLYYANSLSAGTDKTYFLAILASNTTMFYADSNGQTNKVIDDVAYPIFNLYNGTTPVDYSLKLDANNVALTMSDIGSYVGAYKANLGGVLFGSIVNVNNDGTDDAVTTPTLLVADGYNQFSANDVSIQSRNRIRTIVQSYPRGKSNAGAGSQLASGLASRLYFGKKRPMVTSGTGNTIPVETFEVIPYDSLPSDNSVGAANDITGKSAFPRFSQAFNGTTQMWYKANGTPLLFSDLATYSITTDVSLTEYGTWAVTSADAEDYNLSLIATANSLTKKNIPVVYCKQELNLNYV